MVIFVANRKSQIQNRRCRKNSCVWREQRPVPSLEFAVQSFEFEQINPGANDCRKWADHGIHEPPQLHVIARKHFLCVDELAPVKTCSLKGFDKRLQDRGLPFQQGYYRGD
jgi:hypothetical protein